MLECWRENPALRPAFERIIKVLVSYLASSVLQVWVKLLVHGQVTIIFVVSVCLFVCLFVQSFSQPSLIRFRSN